MRPMTFNKPLARNTGPTIVATLLGGKMVKTNDARNPDRANFVIVCYHGDWSGFRTLAECEAQYPALEKRGMEDGYFWVEER